MLLRDLKWQGWVPHSTHWEVAQARDKLWVGRCRGNPPTQYHFITPVTDNRAYTWYDETRTGVFDCPLEAQCMLNYYLGGKDENPD